VAFFGGDPGAWYRRAVSEDDRQRRRMSDATKDRIADLADGWSVPAQPSETPKKSSAKPPTPPPPPPPRGTPAPKPAPRKATDPQEAVATVPYDKAEPEPEPEPESHPEPMDIIARKATRSDADIHHSLTSMRADVTVVPGREDDATTIEPPASLAGKLAAPSHVVRAMREAPTLPRAKGVLGDLRYVLTVISGVRRAKQDLIEVEDEITTLKADRASRLADLGRSAISDDRFDQTAVRSSRDVLYDIEDRRSRHAGAAAAADAELDAIERAREADVRKAADEIAAAEKDIARLDEELGPLERDAAAARKRAAQVKSTLASIDSRITAAKASLVSVKGPQKDPGAIEAELATLRADRQAVSRDEPAIAAELDGLLPRIASLQAARADAAARITAARNLEIEAKGRSTDQVAAVQARRRVESRAAADAKTASERALIELGERLYVERPDDLTIRLGAVDKQDVAIATAQRKAIELRELIGSVERGALLRGAAYWLLLLAAVTALVLLLVL
jgi:hypothetical protein